MKITIENTEHMVELLESGQSLPARLWHGKTESGIYVQLLVVRIAVESSADQSEFEKELKEQAPPTLVERAFPMRLIL